MSGIEAVIELAKEQQKLVTLISYETFNKENCKTVKELMEILNAAFTDLNKLEKYRGLFEKIKKSDETLEYTGDKLTKYYEDIEND